MSTQAVASGGADSVDGSSFDAIVIGAGVAGLYQLYRLRELGLRVRAFEAGSGVGGTWYWNRYPGARFDSESWTYGYSFSQELLDEWDWQEHFAPQPETERYLNYVADKFDLRRDIQFDSRVAAARYREESCSWEIALEDGRRYSTRFLITAIGILSAPTMPNIPGIDTFKGQACHTHAWPKEGVDFTGKRVGIIGTGATAVQTIQEIAKTVGARGATVVGRAGLVPLGQCAVLLKPQKAPGELDHPTADPALPALASPCSRRLAPLSSGAPVRPA